MRNDPRTRRAMLAVAAAAALAVSGAGGYAIAATVAPDTTTQQTCPGGGPRQGEQGQRGAGGQQGQQAQRGGQHGQRGGGQQGMQGQRGGGIVVPAPSGELTAAEAETLALMREEERMAHDLYVALGETFPDRRFENIAAAETRHGEATLTLLTNHGLPDPSAGSTPGVYADAELQKFYDGWLERGLTSKAEALTVGAELERRDIDDLQAAMDATDKPDLDAVYQHLKDGSENHLRAFERG